MSWSIATWNVNSLKVRLPQLLEWLAARRPDVVALQARKLEDAKFPAAEIEAAGYRAVCSVQKTSNGVALLARTPRAFADVQHGLPGYSDEQKRVLAATVDGVRVIDVYCPNGQAVGTEKYAYKLEWYKSLAGYVAAELARYPELVVLGDFNVAPADEDVYDPAEWEGQVLFSEPEKAALREVVAAGLVDSFRNFAHPLKTYTWWDYRMNAFKRNRGLRIDHVLVSTALARRLTACDVDVEPRRAERPSDHAPVVATFST